MKILYATQATGSGRIARTAEIIPLLQQRGEVHVLLSGADAESELPFEVSYRFKGLGFSFENKGGVDLWNAYWKLNSRRFFREIRKFPVEKYDLIISDFEPVSAWAASLAKKDTVGLSSQLGALHPLAAKPRKTEMIGKMMLERFAPTTFNYGFHFKRVDNTIFTPIVRQAVREAEVNDKGHYTVFLPSYSDEKLIKNLKKVDSVQWQVFSPTAKNEYRLNNVTIHPNDSNVFLKSMANSRGLLSHASFAAASEALFLQKKLLVIPMKTNYEQHCYAAMLKSMGVPVMKRLRKVHSEAIMEWLNDKSFVNVNYPDITEEIIERIVQNHAGNASSTVAELEGYTMFQ